MAKDEISGIVYLDKEIISRVYMAPESQSDALVQNCDYGDIHEAIYRYLVDKLGFSSKSFVVEDASKKMGERLIAQVDFIDDGVIMAKLQGIIK